MWRLFHVNNNFIAQMREQSKTKIYEHNYKSDALNKT